MGGVKKRRDIDGGSRFPHGVQRVGPASIKPTRKICQRKSLSGREALKYEYVPQLRWPAKHPALRPDSTKRLVERTGRPGSMGH